MKNSQLIQNFTISHLQKYISTSNKKKNILLVKELCNEVENIDSHNDKDQVKTVENILTMLKLFKKQCIANNVKSQRLYMLLFFLQTQIQEFELLKSMGVSAINNNRNKQIKRSSYFTSLPNSLLNLPNTYNNFSTVYPNKGIPQEIIDKVESLSIIYVTGSKHNPYGHSLLKLGDQGYIHINTLYGEPQFMDPTQFAKYLRICKCEVAAIQHLNIRNMETAKCKLKKLSGKKWLWRITHHNCLSFAQAIAIAGGVPYSELGCDHGTAKLPINFYINTKINPIYFDSKSMDSIESAKVKIQENNLEESQFNQELNVHVELAMEKYNFTKEQAELYANYRIKDGLAHNIAYATVDYIYNDSCCVDKLFKLIDAKLSQPLYNVGDNVSALSKAAITFFKPINTSPFVDTIKDMPKSIAR